jgi:anhydro-N-acetylmuramic acid kinase
MPGRTAGVGNTELFAGLMSGTSLDGVDVVLADFGGTAPVVLGHVHRAFPQELRDEIAGLLEPGANEVDRCGAAAQRLAAHYARCVQELLESSGHSAADVHAIGVHGQTIRHRPESGYSIQLNAPALLAEQIGIDVIADFRNRDMAAGGQGAPLVPAFHASVFESKRPRVVLNVGGISNISYLPADGGPILGFDCGPGNVLLDLHASRHLPEAFDRDGAFAARGQVVPQLLERLLADPFFLKPPPKSTGRELFSQRWLDAAIGSNAHPAADVQRTLTELTARCVADAVGRWCAPARDVVVCGGGARNRSLMAALAQAVQPRALVPCTSLGIEPEQVEALAFAWLAQRFMRREPGNLPTVTGARGPRILGALYPR